MGSPSTTVHTMLCDNSIYYPGYQNENYTKHLVMFDTDETKWRVDMDNSAHMNVYDQIQKRGPNVIHPEGLYPSRAHGAVRFKVKMLTNRVQLNSFVIRYKN